MSLEERKNATYRDRGMNENCDVHGGHMDPNRDKEEGHASEDDERKEGQGRRRTFLPRVPETRSRDQIKADVIQDLKDRSRTFHEGKHWSDQMEEAFYVEIETLAGNIKSGFNKAYGLMFHGDENSASPMNENGLSRGLVINRTSFDPEPANGAYNDQVVYMRQRAVNGANHFYLTEDLKDFHDGLVTPLKECARQAEKKECVRFVGQYTFFDEGLVNALAPDHKRLYPRTYDHLINGLIAIAQRLAENKMTRRFSLINAGQRVRQSEPSKQTAANGDNGAGTYDEDTALAEQSGRRKRPRVEGTGLRDSGISRRAEVQADAGTTLSEQIIECRRMETWVTPTIEEMQEGQDPTSFEVLQDLHQTMSAASQKLQKLLSRPNGLVQERNELVQERDRLAQERNEAVRARDKAVQERDEAVQEGDRMRQRVIESVNV